ncbi:MAG: DUF485 domain-containing protein [Nitrospirae bacterium]|nr:DUF485 domain-containing protein [Nitrospirota bacterium]
MDPKTIHDVLESREFKEMVARRWTISLILTFLILFVYFGFILVLAFDRSLLAQKIGEHLTLGIPVGVGVILFAWILTGIYVKWANTVYDPEVRRISNSFQLKPKKEGKP